ncbi:MAG: hypothetical protein H6710_14305 [Myxococcales bacterium]|nr:hypothetical protein [Myxococcales bacterium]
MRSPTKLLALSGALALACHGGPAEEPASPRDAPVNADEVGRQGAAKPLPELPPAIATCPIRKASATRIALTSVVHLADVAGVRWLVAHAGEGEAATPALVHLGADGELALTPLPFWSEDVARAGPTSLRLVDVAGKRWLAVDLADPDAPALGEPTPLPEVAENPKGIGADDRIAAFSRYFRDDARDAYIGETFVLDPASGRRLGAPAPWTAWDLICRGGRCFGLASPNSDPSARSLIEVRAEGVVVLQELGQWNCGGATSWERDGRWLLAWSEEAGLGLASLDLASAAVRVDALKEGGQCPGPRHLRHRGDDLLVISSGQDRLLTRTITPTLEVGETRPILGLSGREQVIAAVDDGLVVADFSSGRGMIHSPTDSRGIRRYYHVWDFDGRAGLLRASDAGWTLEDVIALPESGSEGDFSTGYRVHLLTRPGRAAALVIGDGSLGSFFLPLRQPCR